MNGAIKTGCRADRVIAALPVMSYSDVVGLQPFAPCGHKHLQRGRVRGRGTAPDRAEDIKKTKPGMTEQSKQVVLEQLWLTYLNDTLFTKGAITDAQRDHTTKKACALHGPTAC